MKSARKAKDKLHKACERASETREQTLHGQEQNNAHGKHERVMRQGSISSQHTSTITCTVAPRVWHFSAFHSYSTNCYLTSSLPFPLFCPSSPLSLSLFLQLWLAGLWCTNIREYPGYSSYRLCNSYIPLWGVVIYYR